MADIFLGVDAGGTKTHAALMNSDGDILGLGVAATGNWERVGFDACALALSSAIDGALRESGHARRDISDATFALAGIDWDSDATVMQGIVRGFGLNCVPTVMNDAFAVLYAGTPDGRGCASIAGTGGKTVAYDGIRSTTTLGMSLGEGGGAGQIVDEALRVLAEMQHGQRELTPMMAEVLAATGFASSEQFFQSIARDDFALPEAMAPLFFDLAWSGDSAAIEVIHCVARQHARDVVGIVSQLDFNDSCISLVCAGGLHTAGSSLFDCAFRELVNQSRYTFEISTLTVVPVVGALIHAVHQAARGFTPTARSRLFAQALKRKDDFNTVIPKAS